MTVSSASFRVSLAWTASSLVWAFGTIATAAERIDCPDGTSLSEVTFADGTEVWCARPDGTRHGPYQKRDMQEHVVERGYWEEGVQAGQWRFYSTSGRLIRTGQMSAGRPDGAWTHFSTTGEPSATITHGQFPAPDAAPPQPADPRYRWQLDLGGTPTAWWSAGASAVAIAVGTDRLVVVSTETGALQADIPLPAPLRPDLLVEPDRILAVTGPGELFVADILPDGGGTWQRVRTPVGVTHVLQSDNADEVVVRAGNGRLSGIDLITGDPTWSGKLHVDDLTPISVGNLAVGVREGREVRAVIMGDGTFGWQARLPGTVRALGSTDRLVLVAMQGGGVQALDRSTGAPLWDLAVTMAPGVQPRWVNVGGDTWLTTPLEAWRLDTVRGVVLDRYEARPPEGQKAADFSVGPGRTCTTGRQGGIVCAPGDWELPTEAPALPPLVGDHAILVAEPSGRITALDPDLTTAIGSGTPLGATLLVDDELDAVLTLDRDRIDVTVPWVVVERARPDDACSVTTAAIQLPEPAAYWLPPETSEDSEPTAPLPDPILWIDDLPLYADLGEGEFRVHDDWETEDAGTTWRMTWWHQHRPTLTALLATVGDNTDPAEVDALVRCEGPPARFAGIAQLEDGYRTFRTTGNLELTPHPHSLDGIEGCLLDLSVSGVDHGAWSSPIKPAWSEVVMEVRGIEAPEALPAFGPVTVPAQLVGEVRLDAYEPWTLERTEVLVDGAVDLRIDFGDPRGPMLRAFHGTQRVLELPVPELTYGQVDVDDDGTPVPAPTFEDHVHLSRAVPSDTGPDTWRVLWTRSSCTADLEPELAAPPAEEAKTPAPSAPPTTRPTPLPPAQSRWRRKRSAKPDVPAEPKPD